MQGGNEVLHNQKGIPNLAEHRQPDSPWKILTNPDSKTSGEVWDTDILSRMVIMDEVAWSKPRESKGTDYSMLCCVLCAVYGVEVA